MEEINHIKPNIIPCTQSAKQTISISIPITKNYSYDRVNIIEEYSLERNNFNPGKMSPPDHWKGRLQQRMKRFSQDKVL